MALRAFKQPAARLTGALALFRNCCRNVPTVLTLFDVDMSVREARGKVKDMFRQNAHIEDPRTAAILVHKGKAELQEAMLQYKTKAQIMYLLEPRDLTEKQNSSLDADEAEFFRGS
mmetsp:Transcript_23760/g.62023  ORF Transcript_23760/g.62023 Transcript_23760/m.62023 type:complete len:116 (+) Transcript_23760:146-493(+)